MLKSEVKSQKSEKFHVSFSHNQCCMGLPVLLSSYLNFTWPQSKLMVSMVRAMVGETCAE